MAEAKVSVIVPVYKAENYLKKCVNSLLNQTYKNLEIILVDDGSPDACPEICEAYAKKDSRVKVLHQENRGASAAKNAALEIACGDYMGFADSDDWAARDMFQNLVGLAQKYNAEIVMCNSRMLINGKEKLSEIKLPFQEGVLKPEEAMENILSDGGYCGYMCNKLYSAKFFKGENPLRFDENIFYCEDLLLNIKSMLRAKKIAYTKQAEYYYLYRTDSISHGFSPKTLTILKALKQIAEITPPKISGLARALYADHALNFCCHAMAKNYKTAFLVLGGEYKKSRADFERYKSHFSKPHRIRAQLAGLNLKLACRMWNYAKRMR
ncbi:MAG: glycosyltransferase family 2 protein [Oscillospiraceae bacterium]|nr:glycosyltransferase family 2 protein [Oscillospiraceae bacterium]